MSRRYQYNKTFDVGAAAKVEAHESKHPKSVKAQVEQAIARIRRQEEAVLRETKLDPSKLELAADVLDTRAWQNVVAGNEDIDQRFGTSPAMLAHGGDLFLSLNRPSLALKPAPVNERWARLLAKAIEQPEWQELRSATVNDDNLAAYASVKFWEHLKDIDPDMSDAMEQESQASQKEQQAEELEKTADQLEGVGQGDEAGEDGEAGEDKGEEAGGSDEGSEPSAEAKQRAQQLRQSAGKLRQEAQAAMQKAQAAFKESDKAQARMQRDYEAEVGDADVTDEESYDEKVGAPNTAAGVAAKLLDDLGDLVEAARGFGVDKGEFSKLLINPQTDGVFDNRSLREFLKLAGRLEHVIGATLAKQPAAHPDKVDVVMGNDLRNVLPAELAGLDDEDLELLFLKRYADAGLLQFNRETRKLGKGAFIICVDESGSMGGQQNKWAKALTVALVREARRQGRKFGVVCFGSGESECRAKYHPKPMEFMDFISGFYGGGTDFQTPLTQAMKMLRDNERDADIVFITDGECSVRQQFLSQFKRRTSEVGARVLSILIGGGARSSTVQAFSDAVFTVSIDPRMEHGGDETLGTADTVKALVTRMV